MPVNNKMNVLKGRKLSLEGATVIGTGAAGAVYLLPDDNVVKVLYSTDFTQAEQEILLAKWAFSKGLPTAISYDVADVDGHPGLVYESLGRDNLRNRLRDNPDKEDSILAQYLKYVKNLNSIVVEPGQLPSAKKKMADRINGIRDVFHPAEYQKIAKLIDTVPEDNHLVHGDCHIKNIKVVGEQLYLIDLDTLSYGDSIFELVGICCAYHAYVNDNGSGFNTFFEIDDRIIKKAYTFLTDNYFPGISDAEKRENLQKIELFTYVYMLWCLDPANDKELFEEMLSRVRARLDSVDNLILKR